MTDLIEDLERRLEVARAADLDRRRAEVMARVSGLSRQELYFLVATVTEHLRSTPGDCDDE